MLQKRNIRKAKWSEEVSEYFNIPQSLLEASVSEKKRLSPKEEPPALKDARKQLSERFMSPEAQGIYAGIINKDPKLISDNERSCSWKEYIFVCINGEMRSFRKMYYYDIIINSIVKPMLKLRDTITVLDYGCGSSLFTRMLSQDFGNKIKVISVDVCRYAVEFSVARNRLYNQNASGMLIEDVQDTLNLKNIDLILALAVFEHLPNSTSQIQSLINALNQDGMLIENYSGHSSELPHKSDTFNAYKARNKNLDMLKDNLTLLYGKLPQKTDGIYARDSSNRFWLKGNFTSDLSTQIIKHLRISHSPLQRLKRKIKTIINSR